MTNQPNYLFFLLAGILFVISPPSHATAEALTPPKKYGAGVIIIASASPYEDHSNDFRVFPMISYTGERLSVFGPFAKFKVYKNRSLTLNLTAEYAFAIDAFEESQALSGMNKREGTALMGLDANIRFFERWRLDAAIKSDVLGRHDGQKATIALSQTRRLYKTFFTPSVGATWHSSNYNAFYYGVKSHETALGRPEYAPGASIEWFLKFSVRHVFSENLSLLASGNLEFLSNDITDSPIVSDDVALTGFVSANYAF